MNKSNCIAFQRVRRLAVVSSFNVKVKLSRYRPGQALGFQEVETPEFLENRHMKVVRLSALRTDRLYPPGRIPGTHFC